MPEPVSLIDPEIDFTKPIFTDIDTTVGPRFSTAEVAKFFFGRSPHWMRWRERSGMFTLDGESIQPERSSNIRSYTLSDIERLCHALAQHGAIDALQLRLALRLLHTLGRINRLL